MVNQFGVPEFCLEGWVNSTKGPSREVPPWLIPLAEAPGDLVSVVRVQFQRGIRGLRFLSRSWLDSSPEVRPDPEVLSEIL
jgi:hypothetical protein